ncbi:hypothetical protein [Microbacterium deminutum]|uniref:MmcQ/YjbR family DNA-binding protein n=1 Tax=Microbacterium deminutum TaxID=344164 RepID=A0ABN2RJC5_9MICO
MPTLDDLRNIADGLPGSEERATTGGAAWFVRSKLYAWECHPWPSVPDEIRAILAAELVVAVKVADRVDAFALVEMQPEVFLRTTTPWGEPKVAFRLAAIDADHLAELMTEAWRLQAPKYLRHELDAAALGSQAAEGEKDHNVAAGSGEDLDVQSEESNLPE